MFDLNFLFEGLILKSNIYIYLDSNFKYIKRSFY